MLGEIYQHDVNSNYLVIHGKNKLYKGFSDRMIQENKVAGLLPCQYRFADGQTSFYYKISSLQSFSQLFEKRKIVFTELVHILREIEKNWKEIESYLISPEKIVLQPEYIFTDFNLEKIYFCYYPDYEEIFSYDRLAAFFVDNVDYNDNKAVELAYGFHGGISAVNSTFSEVVTSLLKKKKEEPEEREKIIEPKFFRTDMDETETERQEEKSPGFSSDTVKLLLGGAGILAVEIVLFFVIGILEVYQGIAIIMITAAITGYSIWSQWKKDNLSEDEPEDGVENEPYEIRLSEEKIFSDTGERVYSEPVGQTVFLARDTEMEKHSLIYQGKDKIDNFDLNVYPFVIGKAEKGIDGTIMLPEISRIHCRINFENSEYRLQDLNSTNGTYINGRLLEPREEIRIQPGDRILLANQPFIFQ